MAIIIDLIVIALLVLSTYVGYKKGLIGVAFKIVSFAIAIVITLILFKPISNYIIKHTEFAKTIETTITQKLENENIENGKLQKEDTNLPNVVVDYINGEVGKTINQAKDTVITEVAKSLSETIINFIVIIALFIITRLLLIFAKTLLEAVSELPIIKQFNETGGIIYGILRGILVIYIILGVISLILPMVDKTTILGAINSTFLTKFLYNNNIILMIFF